MNFHPIKRRNSIGFTVYCLLFDLTFFDIKHKNNILGFDIKALTQFIFKKSHV